MIMGQQNKETEKQCDRRSVTPRFSDKQMEQMAFDWSSDRSVGDAEQDSQCMYDFKQGLRRMQNLFLNGEQLVCGHPNNKVTYIQGHYHCQECNGKWKGI